MTEKVGRPLLFKTPEELDKKIKAFFESEECDYTITGLAIHLECDRETLLNYEKKDEFFGTIRQAKLKIENAYEKRLITRGNSGDIFALKNFGWVDKMETENKNVNLNSDIEIDLDDED
jgi:hypothetical protein